MALGLVSPLLNRGVRSRWLASLPGAGSKMLTIDSNGDTSFQDIPVAAWGSITGTLSAQTDLQNALNAKLSLTGGTLTGGLYFSGAAGARLEMSSQQYTPSNVAINMPWGSGTLQGIYGSNGLVGFASAGFSYFEVNTSGLRLASTRSIAMGGTIASPEVFAFSGGSNVWEQRNSTNAQRFNLYGTYTDASNYRRLYVSSTTAGAFTLGVEGAGTGASGNTLTVPNAMSVNGTLTMTNTGGGGYGNIQITGGSWWLYAGGAIQARIFNVNGWYGMSDLSTGGLSFGSGHGISWGSGSLNVPASGSITGDLFLYRNAAGQLDIRGDSGLRVRNVANTADAPITAAAGTFSGNIAVGGASLLGGTYSINIPQYTWISWAGNAWLTSDPSVGLRLNNGAIQCITYLGFGSNNPSTTILTFDAADIIAQRRSTNSQTLRIYNTFTDASNYIRQSLSFTTYSTTVYAQLAAEGAGTGAVNVPFVITPRGTGAFILGPMPNGTATGGNARGQYAVDLQVSRGAASQVASGTSSFQVGENNTAAGYAAACIGGGSNTASGERSVILGGIYNSTTVPTSSLLSGMRGSTYLQGQSVIAFGGRPFNAQNITGGECQSYILTLSGYTTGTTQTRMRGGDTSETWDSYQRITIRSGYTLSALVCIKGIKSDGTAIARFWRFVDITRIGNATTLDVAAETIGTDRNPSACTITIQADDTNEALEILVGGVANETWRWTGTIYGTEIKYGT